MKWSKAIEKIEKSKGAVEVTFHHKWMKDHTTMMVDEVVEYEYDGKTCKAVNLMNPPIYEQINEGAYIIDEVKGEGR